MVGWLLNVFVLVRADKRWITLTNALSGLFCASLNFIDSTRTIRPVLSFDPMGDHPQLKNATAASASTASAAGAGAAAEGAGQRQQQQQQQQRRSSRLHLLHGTLPREPVCTENLTPFLKLLPCKGKAGISTLLDGHKLFDASWQSMAIDVRPVCPPASPSPSAQEGRAGGRGGRGRGRGRGEGEEAPAACMLEIDLTVDMVLDIERSKRRRGKKKKEKQKKHKNKNES